MKRGSGVLMHISSLPGPYGVGCFGSEVLDFARLLVKAGISYWQVLPFSIPGAANSPYMSVSAFAGNPMFIDPEDLQKKGWVTVEERRTLESHGDPHKADFGHCTEKRDHFLRKAFGRISEKTRREVEDFIENREWLQDLALFLMIRRINDGKPWWLWSTTICDAQSVFAGCDEPLSRKYLYRLCQYLFFTQWNALKKEMNSLGFVLSEEIFRFMFQGRVDVWSHASSFSRRCAEFLKVLGVPVTGKRPVMGNPLYAVRMPMRITGGGGVGVNNFGLMIFEDRSFSRFSCIGVLTQTGKTRLSEHGKRVRGRLFLIESDWITPTFRLLRKTWARRRRISRIFWNRPDFRGCAYFNSVLMRRKIINTARIITRDLVLPIPERTIMTLPSVGTIIFQESGAVREYCGLDLYDAGADRPEGICKGIIRSVMQSHAGLVIFPLQDILFMDTSRRMNIPGTQTGNWSVRFLHGEIKKTDAEWLYKMNWLCGRI